MKKKLILAGIVVWVLIVGVIVTVIVAAARGGGISMFADTKLVKEDNIKLEEQKNLIIECDSGAIEVVAGTGDEIKVEQYGGSRLTEEELFQVKADSNTIQIQQKNKIRIVSLNFSLDERLVIEVPKKYAGNVELKNSSGGIRVKDHFVWDDLKISNSSGGIKLLDKVEANNVNVKVSSGGILIEEKLTAAGTVELKSSSGGIKALTEIEADTINVTASSGGIKLGDVMVNEFKLKCSSGHLRADSLSGGGEVRSTSGGMEIGLRNITSDVYTKSNSGGTKIYVDPDMEFSFTGKASSGGIKSNFPMDINDNKNRASAVVGKNPSVQITSESSSGGIKINQQ